MKTIRKRLMLVACCASAWFSTVSASQGFIVQDIKINGLKRVSEGTVLNYLPVQVGEEVNADSTPKIIRSLYETGFFQSVVLERQGSVLIVQVVERSTIGSIAVIGNTEIPNDKMKDLLKEIGLVKGQVYQRSSLELLKKNLKQAYNARGKYNARITSKVTPLTENRVAINVSISEGRVSRIKDIKIIGNHDFPTHELLSQLALARSTALTYFTKKDQYSKAAMDASLESLHSFYLDHGYLKFKIVSSQVLLAPDRKDVFINIYIEEGPQYRFSGYEIQGKTIIAKEKLAPLIDIKAGEIFSRKFVTQSIKGINTALGDIGYGFPVVNAEPIVDETHRTVLIRFLIEPGRHVYVRRINFHGNTKTSDDLLRNVIRQSEGSLLSLHNIKESERQLRLLSYLKDIDIKTTPIPGANNQVDLDVQVAEAPSAEASASIGYGSTGPQVNAALNQYNFMGTGRTVGFGFDASWWGQNYSFNYYNPFYSKTGIGRGMDAYFQKVDPSHLDVSRYNSDRYGGDINYSIRLSDASSFQFGYGYQGLSIQSTGGVQSIQNFVNLHGSQFDQVRLVGGWTRNSYDTMPFPTMGTNQQAVMWFVLPASNNSLNYYKGNYQAHAYYPIYKGFIWSFLGSVGYGNTYNADGLPFYENYFAGGIAQPGQVRGYQNYSLGPIDSRGNALGANLLTNGSAGIILPYPLSRETIRTTVFVDGGNVFAVGLPENLTGSASGPVRFSGGVSLEWRSPLGPLVFSLASPINAQPRDQTQYFQFSASTGF